MAPKYFLRGMGNTLCDNKWAEVWGILAVGWGHAVIQVKTKSLVQSIKAEVHDVRK